MLPASISNTTIPDYTLNKNVACLATNIYKEARGEPVKGQYAVAYVTLNRSGNLYNICRTVYEPYQFSWTIKNPKLKYDDKSLKIALASLKSDKHNKIGKSTYFHATYVSPQWASKYKKVRKIGKHIFYEKV